MAISYAANVYSFVDSQYGTASTANVKNLVDVAIDRRYHKQVQKKTFWQKNGMIGPDVYREGTYLQTAPGVPVIRKEQLSQNPGDTIEVGLRRNLSFAVSTGVVADVQLVDSEVGWDFYDMKVKIEEWRQGVRTNGGMNQQRNPYENFEAMEADLLSDWAAQTMDTSILYAGFYGFAPHLFRQYGSTNLVPAAGPTLIGNDETLDNTRTVASLSDANQDNISARTFELAATYMEQNDYDPVLVDGEPIWVALVSPYAWNFLMKDTTFRNTLVYAAERGSTNPLFRNTGAIVYGNCLIMKYDKIRTVLGGRNPAGLTVAGPPGAITEADYTGVGGVFNPATQLHQTIFLGANALALAEGRIRPGEAIRAENDYGKIIGRSTSNIYGVRRCDFLPPGSSTNYNQSSLKVVNTIVPI